MLKYCLGAPPPPLWGCQQPPSQTGVASVNICLCWNLICSFQWGYTGFPVSKRGFFNTEMVLQGQWRGGWGAKDLAFSTVRSGGGQLIHGHSCTPHHLHVEPAPHPKPVRGNTLAGRKWHVWPGGPSPTMNCFVSVIWIVCFFQQ